MGKKVSPGPFILFLFVPETIALLVLSSGTRRRLIDGEEIRSQMSKYKITTLECGGSNDISNLLFYVHMTILVPVPI